VVFSSESVTGIAAAISAGVAVGVVGADPVNQSFRLLTPRDGFPSMPASQLVLECRNGADTELSRAMARAIADAFRDR
jgi:hypothetical protein